MIDKLKATKIFVASRRRKIIARNGGGYIKRWI
jgi:hypothetical protein